MWPPPSASLQPPGVSHSASSCVSQRFMKIGILLFLLAVVPAASALGERSSAVSLDAPVFLEFRGVVCLASSNLWRVQEKSSIFSLFSSVVGGGWDWRLASSLCLGAEAGSSWYSACHRMIFYFFGTFSFWQSTKTNFERKEPANFIHQWSIWSFAVGSHWLHLSWQPSSKGTGTPIYSRELSEVRHQAKVTQPGFPTQPRRQGLSPGSESLALLMLSSAEMSLNS